MYRATLSLCAESVIRDGETNNVTAVNLLEQVNASMYPVALTKFAALFGLAKDPVDHQTTPGVIRITLNKNEIAKFPINIDFQGKDRTRVIVNLQGLVATTPGVLRTALWIGGNELGAYDTEFT